MEDCKNCGTVEGLTRERRDTPHHAEVICNLCNAHIKWLPKPKNEEARRKRPKYPKPENLGIGYCEICQLPKENLLPNETLETHHIDGNARNDGDRNYLVVCTCCHAWVNHQRTYRMKHYLRSIGIYEETIKRFGFEEK